MTYSLHENIKVFIHIKYIKYHALGYCHLSLISLAKSLKDSKEMKSLVKKTSQRHGMSKGLL